MTRLPPAAVTVMAVIGFTVAISATSHTSVWAPSRSGVADPLALLTTVAFAFLMCLVAAGAIALALRRDPKQAWVDWLPGIVVAAALVSLLAISRAELQPARDAIGPQTEAAASREGVRLESDWRGPAVRRAGEEESSTESGTADSDAARVFRRFVLVLGAVALALLVFLRRPTRRPAPGPLLTSPNDAARSAAHSAVIGTIAAMLADFDPKTAIIGAYARLQENLETSDASRKAYEGPTEHLHRVLSILDVRPAPLKTLIGLFEVARFSNHSLTGSDRDAALTALREVAADLATPPAAVSAVEGPVG